MKRLLILLTVLFSYSVASAQSINADLVPKIVKDKMQEKYPNAKGLYWQQSKPGFVEAYFNLNKQKCNSIFAASGEWVSTDFEIPATEFPQPAIVYLKNVGYADKVTNYYRSESTAEGTQYSADAKVDARMYQFIFDQDGKLVMRRLKD